VPSSTLGNTHFLYHYIHYKEEGNNNSYHISPSVMLYYYYYYYYYASAVQVLLRISKQRHWQIPYFFLSQVNVCRAQVVHMEPNVLWEAKTNQLLILILVFLVVGGVGGE